MNDQDARETAADLHRLANDIEQLAQETETLAEENVNTETANSLLNKQDAAQADLRQLTSNLIQLHAESGEIAGHPLALRGSVPIPSNADTQLPAPDVGKPAETGEVPSWAKDTTQVSSDQ